MLTQRHLHLGRELLHISTKTGPGPSQQHVIKLNVRFVCAINEQEVTLIRKEGNLYEEKLESLQGTVVPEYRGYALKTSLVGGTVLAAIALYTIPDNARSLCSLLLLRCHRTEFLRSLEFGHI